MNHIYVRNISTRNVSKLNFVVQSRIVFKLEKKNNFTFTVNISDLGF